MNIHITLVGGQMLPVYQGIIELNPDKVIFIHSVETKKNAEYLRSVISTESELHEVDSVDLMNVVNKCTVFFEDINSDISVNITSGTKIMSLALFQLSNENPNSCAYYIDQNNNIYNFNTKSKSKLQSSFSIEELFKIGGFSLKSYRKFSDVNNSELKHINDLKLLIKSNAGEYYKLLNQSKNRTDLSEFETLKGSFWKYDKQNERVEVSIISKGTKKIVKKVISTPKVFDYMVNTGWFEIEIAQILSKWKYCKDLVINAKVPTETGADKNEIDIIVKTENKLLFIECKLQVNDIKDIDKFRNVVKNYGGLGAKSILITDQPIKKRVEEKCNDNGIIFFNMKEARENVFLLDKDLLFMKLESELFSINPK